MYKLIFIIINLYLTIYSSNNIVINTHDNTNYEFEYKAEKYIAIYTYDNWKIIDSYKINDEYTMRVICSKLISIHPIHSSDYNSYRTVEDLVYEWKQHNLAYFIMPNNKYKLMAKDVDLNPSDQSKTYIEIYKSKK